ncbi:8-oxo-dGTP diphosphatase [Trichinella spiralis]|uniref:8-oxo-dGTP diphosphatase n=1 Tax=Trichinella spiralis TaxID=6334 RepID=A0ABR3K473_TRISP
MFIVNVIVMAVSFILIKIISPERCSSLVFSINYKWQPVPVSASGFSIIKKKPRMAHPIAELLSYADDLAKKRRNCGSCFLACYQQYQATTRSSTVIKLKLHPLLKEKEDEYLAAME